MSLKKNAAPLLFAVLGGLGFIIRKGELSAAYEPTSGLFEPWHILSVLLLVLTVGGAVLAFYFSRHHATGDEKPVAICWQAPHFLLGLVSAVLLGLGAYSVYSGLWFSTFALPWLEKLLVLFAAVCALCIVYLSCVLSKSEHGFPAKTVGCVPPLFLCIWLLYFYRVNAINPALQAFIWQCLCLALAALGTFHYVGLLYGAVTRGKAVWCLLMAEYLGLISLADPMAAGPRMMLGAVVLWVMVLVSSAVCSQPKE